MLQVLDRAAWMKNPEGTDPYGWLVLDPQGPVSGTPKIPLSDGAALLGLPVSPRSKRVVIVEGPGGPAALLVDRVAPGLRDSADRRALPRVLENLCPPCFSELVTTDRGFAFLCCPKRLWAGGAGETNPPHRAPAREARSPAMGEPPAQRLFLAPVRVEKWGRLFLGFSIAQVAEVVEPLPVIPVPSGRAHVRGMIGWRAQPVPLLDPVRLILGEPALPHGKQHFLVLRSGVAGEYLSCAVDPGCRVEPLSAAFRPEPHPGFTRPDRVRAVFRFEDVPVIFPGPALDPGGWEPDGPPGQVGRGGDGPPQ